MRLRLNVPDAPAGSSDWSAEQRERLRQTVLRAIAQAADAVSRPGLVIEIAPSAPGGARNATAPNALPRGAPRERADAARLQGEDSYRIPSFDGGGAPTDIPLDSGGADAPASDAEMEQSDITTGAGDRIVRREFPRATVIAAQGNNYYFAGGSPYAIAPNLPRAMSWGRILFGGLGFAVFAANGSGIAGPFYAVGLTEPLAIGDVGGLGEAQTVNGAEMAFAQGAVELVSPAKYKTVLVVTRDGQPLLSSRRNALWNLGAVQSAMKSVPPGQRSAAPEDAADIAQILLKSRAKAGGDSGELEMIVNMDHTVFAAMPWEMRERYLRLLIAAWTGEREEIAILEIIRATRSGSELEAIFALLRSEGVYEQLFDDLDGNVYDLLKMLAEYSGGAALDWRYAANLLFSFSNALPGLPSPEDIADPMRPLRRVVAGIFDWLQSTLSGIWMLLSHPDKAIEGLGHLAELLWTFQRAKDGDPQATAFVARMVSEAGAGALKAIRGLQYAEALGSPYGKRADDSGIGKDILGRLQAALIVEVLTWFIGIGEIKAAIKGAELSERLAGLARLLGILGRLGRAGEAGAEAAKLERVWLALARLAKITDESRIARIAELLPEEHAALIERMAKAAELPEDAGAAALKTALRGHPDLLREVDRLADALDAAGRLEARAAGIGGVTADMADGLKLLLRSTAWESGEVGKLIEDIPFANLDEFMRTLRFVPPGRFRTLSAAAFRQIAEHPRAMGLLREAGAELFERLYKRAGTGERLDEDLLRLEGHKKAIGDPAEYQKFLQRLEAGDPAAMQRFSLTESAWAKLEAGEKELAGDLGKLSAEPVTGDALLQAGQDTQEALKALEARPRAELETKIRDLENEITAWEKKGRKANPQIEAKRKTLKSLQEAMAQTYGKALPANFGKIVRDVYRVVGDPEAITRLAGEIQREGLALQLRSADPLERAAAEGGELQTRYLREAFAQRAGPGGIVEAPMTPMEPAEFMQSVVGQGKPFFDPAFAGTPHGQYAHTLQLLLAREAVQGSGTSLSEFMRLLSSTPERGKLWLSLFDEQMPGVIRRPEQLTPLLSQRLGKVWGQ